MNFYNVQKCQLIEFLSKGEKVRSAIIMGEAGLGKSNIIKEVVAHSNYVIISFEKEFRLPFEYIIKGFNLSIHQKREEIVSKLSQEYIDKKCVIFENFEYCDKDSFELIKQVIEFHKENGLIAINIIEWNSIILPDYMMWENILYIVFSPLKLDDMQTYIKSIIKEKKQKRLTYLCGQLSQIAKGNLFILHLTINILIQKGILTKTLNGNGYTYDGREFQNQLIFLYIDLFRTLDSHIQESLRLIAPFNDNIPVSLIQSAFTQCKRIDSYLEGLSQYNSFILRKEGSYDAKEQKSYIFITKEARDAVTESTQEIYFHQITAQLYQHLEHLYRKAKNITQISLKDKIYLLTLLTKIRNNHLTINHLPYFIELMQHYSDYSAYQAVIQRAEQFIEVNILSLDQINEEQPSFFKLYFRSLLATGQYDTVIERFYKLSEPEWDIKLLAAYAFYNKGNPPRALKLCQELEQYSRGEVFSLEASIYDWLGDNKQSVTAFKKALALIAVNEDLKYTLFKKYSLYVDFELPECRQKIEEALQFYQNSSIRQYAETLHNFGTDNIITFSDAGIKYLEESKKIFTRICEKEVYYPLNSIAIFHCLHGDYTKAIKIWEEINIEHIEVDFCKLAILNNLFCAYIKNQNICLANKMKYLLQDEISALVSFENVKNIARQRPDIQHQVRQFFLNCALLDFAKNDKNSALRYFTLALDCSKYHSTMLHLIQCQVNQLQKDRSMTVLTALRARIRDKKLGSPGKLAKFYADNQIYFCIVMFWGDF